MPTALAALLEPTRWTAFVLLAARAGGLFAVAPLWSMTAIPRTLRGALTVLVAALLAANAPPAAAASEGFDLVLPLASELAIGLCIGLAAAVVVHGAAFAGETMAIQMGLSLGPTLAPSPELEVSGVPQLLALLALGLFAAMGGHLAVVRALADSARALPPGLALDAAGGGPAAAALLGALFECALRVAAPVMGTLLLVQLAMALVGRAVPQLNTLMNAFPVTIAAGLLALGLALPLLGSALQASFEDAPLRAERLLEGLAGHRLEARP